MRFFGVNFFMKQTELSQMTRRSFDTSDTYFPSLKKVSSTKPKNHSQKTNVLQKSYILYKQNQKLNKNIKT